MSSTVSVVRGLILKEVNFGEADKILTILVKDVGKITVSARGARRTKGILSSGTSIFTYGDFSIQTGKKHHFLTQTDVIDSFYTLTDDLVVLSYASCLLELADKTTSEGISVNETLFLIINMLKRLALRRLDPKLALPVYELKLLQYNGFTPQLNACTACGKAHSNIMSTYGTLCTECAKAEVQLLPVNETLLYTMQYILANEPPKLLDFTIKSKFITPLADITSAMVDAHFGITLKSKKFINSLNLY